MYKYVYIYMHIYIYVYHTKSMLYVMFTYNHLIYLCVS